MKKSVFLSVALAFVIALTAAVAAVTVPGVSAYAETPETAQTLPDFTEDFESYDPGGYIENIPAFKEKWENNVLRGGEAQGMDSHLREKARVVYEDGTDGNRVLAVNNTIGADSFFYIGPSGDYRIKNFTASMKVKFLTEGVPERSWVGFSIRKKSQVHYTGTNNLLFSVTRYKNSDAVSGQAYAVFGGGSPSNLAEMSSLYGDKLSLESEIYTIPGLVADEDSDFVEIKLVAEDNTYKLYVDDSMVVDCTFDITSFDYFGKISVNCCTANVIIDDVNIEVNDAGLPPVITPLTAPVVVLDEANKSISWERIDGADGYRVIIDGKEDDELVYKLSYKLGSLTAGVHEISVVAVSGDTFEHTDSAPSEKVTYTAEGDSSGTDDTGPSDDKKESGCKSSAGAASAAGAAAVVLIGAAAVAVKKRFSKIG